MKTILLLFTFFSFCSAIILVPRNSGSMIKKEKNFFIPKKNNAAPALLSNIDFFGFNNLSAFFPINFFSQPEDIIFEEPARLRLSDWQNTFTSNDFRIGLKYDDDCRFEKLIEQREKEDSCNELLICNIPTFETRTTWVADTCWLEDLLQTINIDSCIKEFYRREMKAGINACTEDTIKNIFMHGY